MNYDPKRERRCYVIMLMIIATLMVSVVRRTNERANVAADLDDKMNETRSLDLRLISAALSRLIPHRRRSIHTIFLGSRVLQRH